MILLSVHVISGEAVNDMNVMQPIVTTDGVITHTAAILGGGPSLNAAWFIEETDSYWSFLNRQYHSSFNLKLISKAREWVRGKIGFPVAQQGKFSEAMFKLNLERAKLPSDAPSRESYSVLPNSAWKPYSIFDPNLTRMAPDIMLGRADKLDSFEGVPPSLTVAVDTMVTGLIFEDSKENKRRAMCVEYRPTTAMDLASISAVPGKGVGIINNLPNFVQVSNL